MTVRRLLAAALVALATGAAALAGLTTAPATATSGYCTGSGVNVLVDFTGQGGGLTRACAPQGAGGSAWNAFQQAGVSLTPVQRYPGAVCRVDGRPADTSCVNMPPADAYWGFFTSRGQGWTYASVGPNSYRVANGDTIAFAWQGSSSKRSPAAAPATPHRAPVHSQAPTPTTHPTTHPTTPHTSAPARHHAAPSAHPAATATPTASASSPTAPSPATTQVRKASAKRSGHRLHAHHVAAPTPSPTTAATAGSADASAAADPSAASTTPLRSTAETADTTSSGLPWWAPVLVLVVLAGAGGALVWRRRTGLR